MKHTLFVAGLALISFASCNNPAPAGGDATAKKDSTTNMGENKAERNKKTIMACMEGVNAHDVNKVFANASPDFMEYQDGSMPPQKADSAKQSIAGFFNSFPDMKGENQVYCADGNRVTVTSDWSMTFKNDMGNMKATGKTAKYTDVDIFTLDDNGKILSHRSIYPMGAMMMQMGVDMSKMQAVTDKDMKKGDKKK